MKKVLMTASVPSMIGQFNMDNIRILKELGYQVHVACCFRDTSVWTEERTAAFLRELYENGVACLPVDFSRHPLDISRHIRAFRQLCAYMKQETYAFVHCHTPLAGAVTRLAAWRGKIRVMYTAHGFHFYRGASLAGWLLYYPAEKLLSHLTEVLITVNREDYRRAREKLHAKKTAYIPGVGIDVESLEKRDERSGQNLGWEKRRREKRRELGLSHEDFVLLSVGELSKRKNHSAVIRALARVGHCRWKYVICGIGDQESRLRQMARRLHVEKQVMFAGYRTDVEDFYGMADLFVFPSLQEGMPVALLEAMASGLACLASDIRGNRDLLGREEEACLYTLGDQDMLERKLQIFFRNSGLRGRIALENQKRIWEFDKSRVDERMRKLYETMGREGIHGRKTEYEAV